MVYPTTSAAEPQDPGWALVTQRVIYEATFEPRLAPRPPAWWRRLGAWYLRTLIRYLGYPGRPAWL